MPYLPFLDGLMRRRSSLTWCETKNASRRYSGIAPLATAGAVAGVGVVGVVVGLDLAPAAAATAGVAAMASAAPAQAIDLTSPLDIEAEVNQARRFEVQARG